MEYEEQLAIHWRKAKRNFKQNYENTIYIYNYIRNCLAYHFVIYFMKMYFTHFVHDIFALKCDKSKTCNYNNKNHKKLGKKVVELVE